MRFASMLLLFCVNGLYAVQEVIDPPPPPQAGGPTPPANIDAYTILLLVVGLIYGIFKIYRMIHQKSEPVGR